MFLFQASKRPQELEEFYSRKLDVRFTPEYNYKTFFFMLPDNKHTKRVFDEQMRISEKVLSASPYTKIIFLTESVEQMADIRIKAASGEFGSRFSAWSAMGRFKAGVGNYTKEVWAQDMGEATGFLNEKPALVVGTWDFSKFRDTAPNGKFKGANRAPPLSEKQAEELGIEIGDHVYIKEIIKISTPPEREQQKQSES